MFEKNNPVSHAVGVRFSEAKACGNAHDPAGDSADALRPMEWSELTARLTAARELRALLRRDAQAARSGAAGGFGDAAALYFRTREESEPDVNPVALEHPKCSPGIPQDYQVPAEDMVQNSGHAANGDARDN